MDIRKDQRGFTAVIVMILLALTAFVVAESLKRSQASSKIVYQSSQRFQSYHEAEDSINKVLIHLRDNSIRYAGLFSRDNFYSKFTRYSTVTIPSNDTSYLNVPTKLRLQSSAATPMLASHATLGTSNFPSGTDLFGASVNFNTLFSGASFGAARVRLTLIDGVAENPDLDTTPLETDFDPIFRVDAMTALNSGEHIYGIIRGDAINLFDYGLYSVKPLELGNMLCDSYNSYDNAYMDSAPDANCYAAQYDAVAPTSIGGLIYGKFYINYRSFSNQSKICADTPPAPTSGGVSVGTCSTLNTTYAGKEYAPLLLDQFSYGYEDYCSSHPQVEVYDRDLDVSTSSGNCWDSFSVDRATTATLISSQQSSPAGPYWINELTFTDTTSQISINPDVRDVPIDLYVWTIRGDVLDTANFDNSITNRPYVFRIYYLGSSDLLVTASDGDPLIAYLVAPFVTVTIDRNVHVQGGVAADKIITSNGVGVHYDTTLRGQGMVEDMQFRLRSLTKRYR